MRGTTPRSLRLAGLAGTAVVAALVYVVFAGLPFGGSWRVEAVVPSSNQLKRGSPVRVAGVDVGEVVQMRRGPGDAATIVMDIEDNGRPLHADATLRIRPRLFLEGGFYVDLRAGSPTAPDLPEGGRIPLERTGLPVQFSQVLTALDADLRRALVASLDELARGLGGGGVRDLARGARPLGSLARDGAILAEAARGLRPGDPQRLVGGGARVAFALARRDDELAGLVMGLRQTTDALARRERELRATLRGTDATLAEAPAALEAIDRVLPRLRRTTRRLRPTLRRAPAVLRDADRLLVQVAGLVGPRELPDLLADAAPTVRRLPGFVPRLRRLLGLVTPVTDCLRDQAYPVLFGAVDDGALSTGRPIYLELLHGLAGLGATLQSFDGNGFAGRVQAGGGDQSLIIDGVPGFGTLVGSTPAPVIRSRPVPFGPGYAPPFRPDAECRRQARVDLDARTDATPSTVRRTPARKGRR